MEKFALVWVANSDSIVCQASERTVIPKLKCNTFSGVH